MSVIKDENFVNILGWMVTKLGLKGNELMVYAIIYGFSQDGETMFTGSRKYLAEWCNCSLRSIDYALKSLTDKGYIIKHDKTVNGVRLCDYKAAEISTLLQNLQGGTAKSAQGVLQNLQGGTAKSAHHNIEDNLDKDNLEEKIDKPKRKRFVPPSFDDVETYCHERHNNVDARKFLDYYEMTGWKTKGGAIIKDWKACVRTWERNSRTDSRVTQQVGANGVRITPPTPEEKALEDAIFGYGAAKE